MIDWTQFEVLSFDCYGTLIDWESGIWNGLRPVLTAHNISEPRDTILEIYGTLEAAAEKGTHKPYREILHLVMDGFGERFGFTPTAEERAALAESLQHWYAFPDSVAALHALQQRYKLVILSNVDDDLFAYSQQHLQTEFHAVYTAQQIGSYKPDPRNFTFMVDRLGLPKDRILHVAQSLYHDHKPAKALGFTTVWINRRRGQTGAGATPPTDAQPDFEVPDLQSLVTAIGL